jgi:hypothetical protein
MLEDLGHIAVEADDQQGIAEKVQKVYCLWLEKKETTAATSPYAVPAAVSRLLSL